MITTFRGRKVRIKGVRPEPYREGEQVLIVEDVVTGNERYILKSRLKATGGKTEIAETMRRVLAQLRDRPAEVMQRH